ncbi:MAG: phosphatidylglycerophosphatase A [Mariprofundus sp.]|nr:phosphatidylglycerophosphatase A [Mariprofundus sp.]
MTISNRSYGLAGWIAAGFGSGWLPKAPGTWGSLASLLPAWLLLQQFGSIGLLIAALLVSIIGCWVCAIILPKMVANDPGWIVIDEWAGQWFCLAILVFYRGLTPEVFVLAFIAFRLLDIFKPWPISRAEHIGPHWWSIMADDVVAGIIGGAIVLAGYGLWAWVA